VLLEGVVGKCTLRQVGEDAIPVYNGSMKVRTPEGQERWIKLTAWRKVALWANQNLTEGEIVQAVGRWETNTYNGEERPYFSVRLFQAA
jgi:single-stranded DNA-binding protein